MNKPCPFCGGTEASIVPGSTFRWRAVECAECNARCGEIRFRMPEKDYEKENEQAAWDAWNERAAE